MDKLLDLNINGLTLYKIPLAFNQVNKFTGMSVLDIDTNSVKEYDSDMSISSYISSEDKSYDESDSSNDESDNNLDNAKNKLATKPTTMHTQPNISYSEYLCMGDIKLGHGFSSNTFRLWYKENEYYMEILFDADPEYFLYLNKNDLNKSIEDYVNKYNIQYDVYSSTDQIMVNDNYIPQTVVKEKNNHEIIFYIGVVDDINVLENSITTNRITTDVPVKLSSGFPTIKPSTEYPSLSVFQTRFSKSIIELYVFTRFNINHSYPLVCRCVYYGDNIPVDVQCFINTNHTKGLTEYIDYINAVYCKDNEAFLALIMELYLTFDKNGIGNFLNTVNPTTETSKKYFTTMKSQYQKLIDKKNN